MHSHYCEFLCARGDTDVPAEHEWDHDLDEEIMEEPCCFSERYKAPSCKQCPEHDGLPCNGV